MPNTSLSSTKPPPVHPLLSIPQAPLISAQTDNLSRLGSLLGLLAPGLGGGSVLLCAGGGLDGGGALDGLGAEVGAVALVVGAGDNGAVELAAGGRGLEGAGVGGLGGLVVVLAELGGQDDLAILLLDADCRGVGEARVLWCEVWLVGSFRGVVQE